MEPPAGYSVKWISFLGRQRPILMQAVDGPCPLLAVANIFLLLSRIDIPAGAVFYRHETLLSALGGYLLEHPVGQGPDAQYFVRAALDCLPKLALGLCVDPIFLSPYSFLVNEGADFFDNAQIRLVHAWVVDGAAAPGAAALLGGLSHGQAAARATTLAEGEEAGETLRAWVQLPEQATTHGVRCLMRSLRRHELAALYRAKHFSVIFKVCCCVGAVDACACPLDSIRLCELLTSEAYLHEYGAVWQTLEPTDVCLRGSASILDCTFESSHRPLPFAPPPPAQQQQQQLLQTDCSGIPEGFTDQAWASMTRAEQAEVREAVAASTASLSASPSASAARSSTSSGHPASAPSAHASTSSRPSPGVHDRTRLNAQMVGDARKESMARAAAAREAAAAAGGGARGPPPPPQPAEKKGCCVS